MVESQGGIRPKSRATSVVHDAQKEWNDFISFLFATSEVSKQGLHYGISQNRKDQYKYEIFYVEVLVANVSENRTQFGSTVDADERRANEPIRF